MNIYELHGRHRHHQSTFCIQKNLRTSQNVKFVLSHFVQLAFQQGRSGTHIDTNCLNVKEMRKRVRHCRLDG